MKARETSHLNPDTVDKKSKWCQKAVVPSRTVVWTGRISPCYSTGPRVFIQVCGHPLQWLLHPSPCVVIRLKNRRFRLVRLKHRRFRLLNYWRPLRGHEPWLRNFNFENVGEVEKLWYLLSSLLIEIWRYASAKLCTLLDLCVSSLRRATDL